MRPGFSVAFFALTLALGSQALGVPENSMKEVQQKLTEEHKLLLDAEIQKRGILGTLYDINKDLSKISADIDSIKSQMAGYEKSIESYARIIVRLERIKDHQKTLLHNRLRALYKLGLRGYAELLLSSQTSSDFSRNMKFLKIIAEKDAATIENFKKSLLLLARQQSKLRKQVKTYLEFELSLKTQQKYFNDEKQKQLHILTDIEQDRDSHLQALKEWREAGLKLEEKLTSLGMQNDFRDLHRESFVEKKGSLRPPVFRPIAQRYGMITNERFQTKIFHKGLFFAALPKDKVNSIFWGTVAYSGWIDGYGQTIIIDHGDHYYSLYAHNNELDKKQGDEVSPGETIARAGDTGSLRGPGLYLEIRHFSESLDPLPWLDLPKPTRL